ncbi:hypothetical protein LMH87_002045 [Akanthomyces muscarius]|uniref:Uncharacterized protein n=1 Tax=Akanthomyces muscarius TaxID=2231603 RepID=A0A9W8UJ98_AKAMU|nr:hypothetical protein LMH87_002045 [Akanthomyces muscarius]KAJ4147533.1 hypothetical protein LMH87_002045 [Akanthomyces muscarius]
MATIFNGLAGFFGRRAGAAETTTDSAHSDTNEEQPSSPAQSVPEQDLAPVQHSRRSSSAEHSSAWGPIPPTRSPTRPTEDTRGLPPSYRSGDYFSQLPVDESDDGRLPEGLTPFEQRCSVLLMHRNSLPEHRFTAEVEHEKTRLAEKWAACNLKREYWLEGQPLAELATGIVQHRWKEQGIANIEWFFSPRASHRDVWKHEKVGDDDVPEWVREMDTTRPFFQFMHEVAVERDHLEFLAYPPLLTPNLLTCAPRENREPTPDDLHTTAYYNVRYEQWVARGIWDYSWGALPGMFWRHEMDIRVLFQEHFDSTEGIPDSYLERPVTDKLSFRGRRIDTLRHFPEVVVHTLRDWAKNNPPSPTIQETPYFDDNSPSPAPRRAVGRSGAPAESLFAEPNSRHSQHVGVVPAARPSEPLRGRGHGEEQRAWPEDSLFGGAPRTSLFGGAPEPAQRLLGSTHSHRPHALPKSGPFRVPLGPRQSAFSHLQVEGRRASPEGSLFGGAPRTSLFESALGPGQGPFGPSEVENQRASSPVRGLLNITPEPGQGPFGPAQVESQRASRPDGGLFGRTADPGQGLFGPAQVEEQRALPVGSLFGGTANAGQGLFGRVQSENQQDLPPDGSLLRPFPPVHGPPREAAEPRQGPSTGDGVTRQAQPGPSAQRAPSSSLFSGWCGQKASIREESVASEETWSSAYGDENEEDALEAIHRQFQALQRSTEQVLDAHRSLAAQLSNSMQQRPSARREPTRGLFSGETHQRRVLGPLPSSQRVSKKTSRKTSVVRSVESSGSRAASVSSAATTVIWNPLHAPSQAEPGNSAAAAGSSSHEASTSFAARENSPRDGGFVTSDDDMPRGQDFVIREDTQDVEEDTSMEEPSTEPTPRSRAKRRRRDSAERKALQPLRRSKRRTGTR